MADTAEDEADKIDAFSARFSGRAWKMLKNAALDAKIGVDTADILIF